MSKHFELVRFSSPDALAAGVAAAWVKEVAAAAAEMRPYLVALSGGRITTKFFAEVVAQSRAAGVSLAHVHFFWADERCLPPTDKESNFLMANELLFGPLQIAAGQIHRLRGEDEPEAAARGATTELLATSELNGAGAPVLDLVLLGMGEDGHVASLFPGASREVVECATPFLVVRNSPKPPPVRISLSFKTIAAARGVWVLASGSGKEKALADSVGPEIGTPLGRVLGMRSHTRIFTDLDFEA